MSVDAAARGLAVTGLQTAQAARNLALRPSNRLVGTLGHSKLDQVYQTSGTVGLANSNLDTAYSFRAFPPFLELLLPGAPKLHAESCFAASNTTSYAMATAQMAQVAASPCAFFYVWSGHNDFTAGWALDDGSSSSIPQPGYTLPNFRSVFEQLRTLNRVALVVLETPSGNTNGPSSRWSGNNLKHFHALNRWLIEEAQYLWPGTVYVIATPRDLFDTGAAATRGDIISGLTQDNAHLKAQGSWILAKAARASLVNCFGRPLRPVMAHTPGDVYDATHNPRGNILATSTRNPDLCGFGTTLGTAPGSSGGVTWAAGLPSPLTGSTSGLGGTTALTVTPSLVTTATGDWLQIAWSGNVGASAGALYIDWLLNSTEASFIADGEKTCAFGEFEISQGSTGLQGFPQEYYRNINGGSNYEAVRNLFGDSTAGAIDSILAEQGLSGVWDGSGLPNGRHGQTTFTRMLRHRVAFAANLTGISGSVRMRRLALRKYSPGMAA